MSSLTPDDENRLAAMVIWFVESFFDALPVSYAIRIETSASRVFSHAHTPGTAAEVERRG